MRRYSPIDKLIAEFDNGLNAVFGKQQAQRANPAADTQDTELNHKQQKQSAGFMRVNHTGEVCAQALYRGQMIFARDEKTRSMLQHACIEELDHLAWTHQRLQELNSSRSKLNVFFYISSFALGAGAAAIGDEFSLGYVEETEKQVGKHLQEHLKKLAPEDLKSRKIIEQMAIDEAEHGAHAQQAGAKALPKWFQCLMTLQSKVMTNTTYWV